MESLGGMRWLPLHPVSAVQPIRRILLGAAVVLLDGLRPAVHLFLSCQSLDGR